MSQNSTLPVRGVITSASSIQEMVDILQSEAVNWVIVLTNALLVDCGEQENHIFVLLIQSHFIQDTDNGDSDTLMDYLHTVMEVDDVGPAIEGSARVPDGTEIYTIEVPRTIKSDWLDTLIRRFVEQQMAEAS